MSEVIVISGLAQGMGRQVAKRLWAAGCELAGYDVDAEGLKTLEAELTAEGRRPLLSVLDATDQKGVRAFRDRVLERYGHADVVLANVGIGCFGPFEELDLTVAQRALEVNVMGTALAFQAFLPSMRARKEGRLIAMSSLVGQIPFPFESVYTAAKFAVEGMVLSLRYEVEPFGIRVAIIEPAQVSTGFAAKIHRLPAEGSPYRARVGRFIARDEELIKDAPTPDEAAAQIERVVRARKPRLFNRLDLRSAFFLTLNRLLPTPARDAILLGFMDIRER